MSTPYNNQWLLGRLRARWRRRARAAEDCALVQPPAPPREQPHERAHDRPRPSPGGAVRKRPHWVDRDT